MHEQTVGMHYNAFPANRTLQLTKVMCSSCLGMLLLTQLSSEYKYMRMYTDLRHVHVHAHVAYHQAHAKAWLRATVIQGQVTLICVHSNENQC